MIDSNLVNTRLRRKGIDVQNGNKSNITETHGTRYSVTSKIKQREEKGHEKKDKNEYIQRQNNKKR